MSITILSSVLMKSGTRTSIPVSRVAGFKDFPEVSPFTPGSQYVTVLVTFTGISIPTGFPS